MLEPRGHADMYGALLTEPVTPDADAGVLFMHNEGWSTMCGHGIIAVTTMAIEHGADRDREPDVESCYDTPAGPVTPRDRRRSGDGGAGRRRRASATCRRSSSSRRAGAARRAQDARGHRVRRRVLRDRRQRGRRDPDRCRERLAELRRAGMAIAREVEAS